jgi:sugar phosphate isomerase/epimerase
LGAEVLVLVCGPAADRDIAAAREQVADGIAAVAPYAAERGVKLGIEPLHPAFAGDRSCITTLREARLLAERLDHEAVGVVADVYHIWWDPELHGEIARAGTRIVGFHTNDWLVPATNVLLGRGMMGDGVIELRKVRGAVERAGYATGPIEVEIFNEAIWGMPLDAVLALTKERFVERA